MSEFTVFQKKMLSLVPEIELRFNEPMAKHTSFRIGGNTEVVAFPKSTYELAKLVNASKILDIKPAILGAGTNVLIPDEGMSGLVICLKDSFDGIELVEPNYLRVMAGVTMTRAAVFAANHDLSGLEFAHGIPGSVGGGVYMNAGAYDGEISRVCESVDIMDENGNITTYDAASMAFSYRHSMLEENGGIVVSCLFRLEKADSETVWAKMKELMKKRSAAQPLDKPSAGSAFKRPSDGYAAALIDSSGLKGFRIGDAAVSEKHAGFVVNLGNATAYDVKSVLNRVSQIVFEKTGIQLEPEVRIW